MTKYLVTSALPYANGSIHLGHMVETIQTDVHARALRLAGKDIIYVCADDAHGTPIELNARKQGISPEELVERSWSEHTADFKGFGISFDEYYTTNSPENEALAGQIFSSLKEGGHIVRHTSQQFYSEALGRFLPDRMVRGTCPKCGAEDQYGDSCEVCKSTYEPTELIDPVDSIEGKTPVVRDTEQLYVKLSDFSEFLSQWREGSVPQESIRNFVDGWLGGEIRDWCISRDAPYFGFEIPGEPGKFFYVWLDAPVGYMAATKRYCDQRGLNWLDYWGADADAKITHVIGKDIVYFHTLFWPAMTKAGGFKIPDHVHVHGFLTVNGAKMSKSRGTFIKAATYLEHMDADYLRYYIASKLGPGIDDIDLNLEEFVTRTNSGLVNNVVNLCSRVTKFIEKRFDGEVADFNPADYPLVESLIEGVNPVLGAYKDFDCRGAVRMISELGAQVNLFFQEQEPWKLIKDDEAKTREVCAVALYGANVLMTLLQPVVPKVSARFAATYGLEAMSLDQCQPTWKPETFTPAKSIMNRIEPAQIEALLEATERDLAASTPKVEVEGCVDVDDFKDEIEFDDFAKIDLRVGVVLEANEVPKAKKLLQLKVHCGREINVFAGVRSAYADPSVLVGKRVVVVANLKPRKMRFGVSEGMLLAMSGEDDHGLQLATLDEAAMGGWTVR